MRGGSYLHGTNVESTAQPGVEKLFNNWTKAGAVCCTTPKIVVPCTCDEEYQANFRDDPHHNVTFGSRSSAVSISNTGGRYRKGTVVSCSASYNTGLYEDFRWENASGGRVSTANPISFALNADTAYYANVTAIPSYTATARAGTGISSVSGTATVLRGHAVTFRCSVSAGYRFKGWYESSNLRSSSQTYSFGVTYNQVLDAVAELIPIGQPGTETGLIEIGHHDYTSVGYYNLPSGYAVPTHVKWRGLWHQTVSEAGQSGTGAYVSSSDWVALGTKYKLNCTSRNLYCTVTYDNSNGKHRLKFSYQSFGYYRDIGIYLKF